jgi:hypothetical protein
MIAGTPVGFNILKGKFPTFRVFNCIPKGQDISKSNFLETSLPKKQTKFIGRISALASKMVIIIKRNTHSY